MRSVTYSPAQPVEPIPGIRVEVPRLALETELVGVDREKNVATLRWTLRAATEDEL